MYRSCISRTKWFRNSGTHCILYSIVYSSWLFALKENNTKMTSEHHILTDLTSVKKNKRFTSRIQGTVELCTMHGFMFPGPGSFIEHISTLTLKLVFYVSLSIVYVLKKVCFFNWNASRQ